MRFSRELLGVAALLCVSAVASAQNYPSRPLRILALPDVVERLAAAGVEIQTSTPREWGDFVRAEISKWAKVVKEAGVKVE